MDDVVVISSDAGLDLFEHGAFVQPGEAHHKAGSHLREGNQKWDTLDRNNMGHCEIHDILSRCVIVSLASDPKSNQRTLQSQQITSLT